MSYEVGGEGWVVGQGLGGRACFRAHRTHDCSCRHVPNVLCDVPCRLRIAVHEVLFDAQSWLVRARMAGRDVVLVSF